MIYSHAQSPLCQTSIIGLSPIAQTNDPIQQTSQGSVRSYNKKIKASLFGDALKLHIEVLLVSPTRLNNIHAIN